MLNNNVLGKALLEKNIKVKYKSLNIKDFEKNISLLEKYKSFSNISLL